MHKIIIIFDVNGNFVDFGYINGVAMVKGEFGWFSSLILLTIRGVRLDGYYHMIAPYPSNYLLEHNNAS